VFFSLAELFESRVIAGDGTAGRVVDAYFDERSWRIRRLFVDMAAEDRRYALICSPESIVRIDELESELVLGRRPEAQEIPPVSLASLRSSREIIGCTVSGWTGEIGRAEDAVFESHSWALQFLLVNPASRTSSGIVFIDSVLIDEAHWAEQRLRVALTHAEVLEESEREELAVDTESAGPALH
jgi:hypothetical protein